MTDSEWLVFEPSTIHGIGAFARKDIAAGTRVIECVGEKITFNYGYDLENWEDHPCNCGAVACVGYMIAGDLLEDVLQRQGIATLPGRGIRMRLRGRADSISY